MNTPPKSPRSAIFHDEASQPNKLRRSQMTIAVLSLLVLFLLLNAAYQYVDLSASNLRAPILAASVLAGLLALLSIATLAMSYGHRRR